MVFTRNYIKVSLITKRGVILLSFKKILDKIKLWIIPRVVYLLIKLTNKTIDLKVIGRENVVDVENSVPLLYAFWHGFIWIPVYYYRNRNYITLSSLSRDGEYMTAVLHRFGWKVIRGSSSKGGTRSVLKLYKELLHGGITVLTPDGPTGPRHKVKPGIIYLQEKSDGYIVPLGIAVDKKIELDSWDKFNIPLPFTKTVLKIGRPLQLSSDYTIDKRCQLLEDEINRLQQEAKESLSSWKGNDNK